VLEVRRRASAYQAGPGRNAKLLREFRFGTVIRLGLD
jgi:hypothetical protein